MSRIWMYLVAWLATLVVIAFLIPIIAPSGRSDGGSLITGLLIALQLSGLGIAIYAGVLGWRHRKTPRLMALYAVLPFTVLAGFSVLVPLMTFAKGIIG